MTLNYVPDHVKEYNGENFISLYIEVLELGSRTIFHNFSHTFRASVLDKYNERYISTYQYPHYFHLPRFFFNFQIQSKINLVEADLVELTFNLYDRYTPRSSKL